MIWETFFDGGTNHYDSISAFLGFVVLALGTVEMGLKIKERVGAVKAQLID